MTRWLVIAIAMLLAAPAARADDRDPRAVAKEVSKVRGLRLMKPLDVEVIEQAELRDRVAKRALDGLRSEGFALARWGLIPHSLDYAKLMTEVLVEQLAGYYDPKTKRLTLAKPADGASTVADHVLVHEIGHALQDQAFDLAKFEGTNGDAGLARHALVEGDAIALAIEVMLARQKRAAPWADPEVAAELAAAMALPLGSSVERAPLAVREALLFPYRAGFAFVAALRRRHAWSAVDAAFYKRPPRSSEQILHPELYASDEKPIAVTLDPPPALADYTVAHATTWGELGFSLFLRAHGIDARVAAQAAAGWGGDRTLVLAKSGEPRAARAIGLARLEWDSEADAIEAHETAVRALDRTTLGATADHDDARTRWLAVDGTVTLVERRGTTLVIALGVPAPHANAVAAELWAQPPAPQASK